MKLRPLYWLPSEADVLSKTSQAGATLYDVKAGFTIPGYQEVEPAPENARVGALRAADWLLRTQVSSAENLSGDTGRYFGIRGLYDNAKYLAQNWLTAHGVLAELAAYHETGNEAYLTSARLGGEYLLGLQVLDSRLQDSFGSYREHHARFPLTGSRSCGSVIWAMVQLFKATGDEEYLESARMCGKWFLEKSFPPGSVFPRGEYHIKSRRWIQDYSHVCYGGMGIILHQLYQATHDSETLDRGVVELADKFIKYFMLPDGSRNQSIDLKTGKPTGDAAKSFHIYNDDFAGISLLAAYKETQDKKYLDASLLMARWLAAKTEKNGRLGGVNSAPATALVHFLSLKKMTGTAEFDDAMRRYTAFLLRQQVVDLNNADFYGGIRGQSHVRPNDESGQYLDGRVTSYAVNGLLGFANPSAKILLEVE